jgi:aldehyde dehydrogenase (NAD+)
VTSIAVADADIVDRAVASAKAAAALWRDLAPVERGRLVQELGRRLRAAGEGFVDAEVRETGKLVDEMRGSLTVAADYFEYYGGVVRAMFGETIGLGAGDHAFTTHEPFGVVGMVTPWNGPLTQASRGVAAAIAAGNAVVLKPSEFTSTTSVMLAELATEVGVPPGVLNVVLGTGSGAGAALVSHPEVRLIAFTGSVETGRAVARVAANRLVPVILELGGKSPNIVFADADLDRALASAVSVCASSGQQCAALTRLLVESSVYEEVVAQVAAAMTERVPGERLAPVTTEAQYEKVLSYLEVAARDGARLVAGGGVVEGELAAGRYVQPTVYADVTPQMRIFQEEIFGPVLAVTRFHSEDEAVALANDSEYGLVASVWTRDSARALRVASRIESGQVMVNGGRTGIETPFGGYKNSGLGREKGFESLRHYTQLKTTVVSTR